LATGPRQGLEIVTLPDAARASRRHTQPALLQFVGDAHLTASRLVDRDCHYRLLDCQDNEISWLDRTKADDALLKFARRLIRLRKHHQIFRRRR
jgi:hypothetical protein